MNYIKAIAMAPFVWAMEIYLHMRYAVPLQEAVEIVMIELFEGKVEPNAEALRNRLIQQMNVHRVFNELLRDATIAGALDYLEHDFEDIQAAVG